MGGKARKRREKNYLAAHGGHNRLPPPPNTSSINALPNKLRQILSFSSSGAANESKNGTIAQRKRNKEETRDKPQSQLEVAKKSMPSKEIVGTDANDEKKKKKRKRKQADDLRFEGELEKLGAISKRKQRKKEFLKAKKKKQKKGKSEQILDLPKRDEVKFGEVVEAPPKLAVIPTHKKYLDASRERLRLQAIEAYRSRKGWTNRPGVHLPPVSTSPDL
ncbi:unnamed protein product [Amaranthus hypochondriacus]